MRINHYLRALTLPKSIANLPKSVRLVSFIVFIYMIGWGIVDPYLAIYFKSKLPDYSQVGIIMGLLPLFAVVWSLLLGPIMDAVPKRRMISFTYILYLPISFILLAVSSFTGFILFRTYHSILATSFWLSSESYVRVHSPKDKETESISLYDFGQYISMVIGGFLGAFLIIKLGFSMLYAVSFFIFLALIASFFLPDHDKKLLKTLKLIFKHNFKEEINEFKGNEELKKLAIFRFFAVFCLSFMMMILPLFLDSIGATLFMIGIITALYRFPNIFEPYFAVMKSKKKILTIGIISTIMLFFLMFLTKDVVYTFILSFLLGIATASFNPAIQGRITKTMPIHQRGKLSAMLFTITHISTGISPIMAGIIADNFGLNYVFLLGSVIFLFLLFYMKDYKFEDETKAKSQK